MINLWLTVEGICPLALRGFKLESPQMDHNKLISQVHMEILFHSSASPINLNFVAHY